MARRSIWTGTLGFGLVSLPVKAYIATDSKDIVFATLHECGTRINQRHFCSTCDRIIERTEERKGYEYAKGQYLSMADADFESLPVASQKTIAITQFVDIAEIDPIYFEKTYALAPDKGGEKAFGLLRDALQTRGVVAIATIALRSKEHLCCIRPQGGGLVMETMFYPDEIRGTDDLAEGGQASEQELSMAVALIDQLSGHFDPNQHVDGYRVALEQRIEARLNNSVLPEQPEFIQPPQVNDLMAALQASIAATAPREEAVV